MDLNTPIRSYVYPGHPLVVAYCALKVFPSAKAALSPAPQGWSVMVGHSSIPGSGDAAYNGDRVLRAIWDGSKTIDEAIMYADELWRRQIGPGNFEERYEPGKAEAICFRHEFRTLAAAWDWSK